MIKHKVVLLFPAAVVEQPFLYHLVKDYDLFINILRANINPKKEGRLVVELSGEEKNYEKGVRFLESGGIEVLPFEQQMIWNEERCTHCGACTVMCPTGALEMSRPDMIVRFDGDKCVVCEHCFKACPARAIEAHY